MTPLRQQMIDAMQLRGYSPRTHSSYLGAVTQLARYYHRSPDTLTTDELQAYFLYLVKERGLSGASCRLYLNAIRFFYLQVLHWSDFDVTLTVPKKAQRIPELLSRDEVSRILSHCKNPKHHMLLLTCYGCGLRVSEVVTLKVRDIDGERRLLRITQGKGAKDRHVVISEALLHQLRDYFRHTHPKGWLYPSELVHLSQRHMSISAAQRVFQRAKQTAGIDKVGGIHSLRHAYATHQLDAGLPVHQLQQRMGHQDLHSTLRYVHWLPRDEAGTGADLIADLEVGDD